MTIDLDRFGDDAPPHTTVTVRRRRQLLSAVVLLVVGAVVGGLATYRWQERRQEIALASEVSVVVLPDMGRWVEDSATPATIINNRQVISVHLVGNVTLVNAGPSTVEVLNLSAEHLGLALQAGTVRHRIAPGRTSVAKVAATFDCDHRSPVINASLSVATTDGVHRQVPVVLDGGPWIRQIDPVCGTSG